MKTYHNNNITNHKKTKLKNTIQNEFRGSKLSKKLHTYPLYPGFCSFF